jgi:hypothetical protein
MDFLRSGSQRRIPAMSELFTTTVLPIAAFGIAILFGFLYWRSHQAKAAVWAEFARLHGLSSDGLSLEGRYEGYELRMETATRHERKYGKKRQYTVTVLRLSTRGALPQNFSLEPEGLGDKLLEFLGLEDAEIGDEHFDERFALSGLSAVSIRVLRDESVQQHLYELAHHYETFAIRGGWIQAEHRGLPSTVDELEELLGPALTLAHTLDEVSRRTKGWRAR